MVREIELPSGESIPALGLGTRGLAEGRRSAEEEAAALRHGLDLGIRLVDTAPAYAGGEAEALVGRALAGRRDDAFLLSKVEAERAARPRILAACETSLARLDTDRLDLYVLQGRGDRPLEEIVEAFEGLRERGLIRHWAVGDFSLADLVELAEFDGAGSGPGRPEGLHRGATSAKVAQRVRGAAEARHLLSRPRRPGARAPWSRLLGDDGQLGRHDVESLDGRLPGEQVRGALLQCRRHLTGEVGLAAALVGEGVDDRERRRAEADGEPEQRLRLVVHEPERGLEEVLDLLLAP